ncbi:MAG: hypothetical protein AVDCRST_MAG23-511 [uncultured Sphingosinicella sp.]|uniref:Uncharacterized protein n=1 Tax=uncultured Sphingosinicella sp. TaxID=478748 RepID=A0A6J4TK79_9SPHN|nr:hypothetical protein [uncultured Sphingosinicella sp.]CAA9524716.1 MAG: hypothetical protein AVDCRST_MAG23-511 [uncultured Sphingosinicella sp.]
MSYYRLLFMKSFEGPVMGAKEIAARDDVDAVRIARSHVCEQPLELWCDKRKVKRFPPAEAPQSAFSF